MQRGPNCPRPRWRSCRRQWRLAECHAVIAQLVEPVKVLEERVNLDSNNWSKPPSSNGPAKLNLAQRRSGGRKRGAQPGHKGHSRAVLDEGEVDPAGGLQAHSRVRVWRPG